MSDDDRFDFDASEFNDDQDPEQQLRDMLSNLLAGQGMDPNMLAGVAGLPQDPAMIAQLIQQMQQAMQHSEDGMDASAIEQAAQRAVPSNKQVSDDEAARLNQAVSVAQLWLSEVTRLDANITTKLATRHQWLSASIPTWREMSEPVASSISSALVFTIKSEGPELMQDQLDSMSSMFRSVSRAMFAMQLGAVLGKLSTEVLSGGDIGVPLMEPGHAMLIPQNLSEWSSGLEIDETEVDLYFAVRELAHARLFHQAKWLRLHLVNALTAFARGISIDLDRLESVVRELDIENPEDLKRVMDSGELIPPRTPEQDEALERIETMLALVEGWVDVVTQDATSRLPHADAIAEMVRRRRATGSPAEHAFAALVGLEVRPRRLREATAMWRAVTETYGVDQRDALWDQRDALPTREDIDDPQALIARLGTEPAADEFDADLQRLLDDPDAFRDSPVDNPDES